MVRRVEHAGDEVFFAVVDQHVRAGASGDAVEDLLRKYTPRTKKIAEDIAAAQREAEEKKANLAAQIAAAKATMGARVAALLNEKLAKSWQKISSLFRGRSDVTPLATVCVSGHLVSTPLANVPWLVSLTAPATALEGVPEIRPLGLPCSASDDRRSSARRISSMTCARAPA